MGQLIVSESEENDVSAFLDCVIVPHSEPRFYAGALLCYQCSGTKDGSDCETNYKGLVNTSANYTHNKVYLQNCSDSNPGWDRCMIETAYTNGQTVVFHRGCHDGHNFTPLFNNTRFYNLKPNNLTTCAQLTTWFVCYSFCQTDFCNGPIKPEVKPPCNETELDYDETCAGHRVVSPSQVLYLLLSFCAALLIHALT
ncbi:hypothetical protein Btru_015346 [Bulinus truncatus]|nr:hypothetical protein Btru_015346 [Bulinus truncatus]